MKHLRTVVIASVFAGLILHSIPLGGQAPQILINAKRVYTVGPAGTIENGQVLIEGTKIKAVGTNLSAPGATVYTAESVIPGLIDTHAHVALRRGGDTSTRSGGRRASSAEHRTLDQFNPTDPALRSIVEGGMTTIVTRGSGGGQVFVGQTLAVKLKNAPLEQMILKPYADMKMYVRSGIGGSFLTLMGWRSVARAEMIRAQDYMQRWADFEKGISKERPARDPRLDAYAVLLRRESPIHVHTNYPAEILMVMDFAQEFNLRLSLGHGNYAYRVAKQIKDAGIVPVVGPTYIVQSHDEDRWHNGPAELAAAGVDVALQMDMSAQHNKVFLEVGSLLIRHGMREADALKALTLNGAKAIMMQDRIGSLEPGKDADVVLLDGAPFELQTYVTQTFIDGKLEFELKQKPQTSALLTTAALKPLVAKTTPQSSRIAIVNATVLPISSDPIRAAPCWLTPARSSTSAPAWPCRQDSTSLMRADEW